MAGINIPGVTDQYKTNETVEKLMQIERIPLTREQKTLDGYKAQKDAWRDVNRLLTSLRDSTKTLYSFENPFNSKIASSTDEFAVSAEASRSAEIQSFKIDVLQPATADRFLSAELEGDYKVPEGIYTFKLGEKELSFNWKGGSLKDFSEAINKRGKKIIKTSIMGASAGKKTFLIEGLATGKENQIIFEGKALDFAKKIGMITSVKPKDADFGKSLSELTAVSDMDFSEPAHMPKLDASKITLNDEKFTLEPRTAFKIEIPSSVRNSQNSHVTFTVKTEQTDDITEKLNSENTPPTLPNAGSAVFGDIEIFNADSEALLKEPLPPLDPINSADLVYAVMSDGAEKLIQSPEILGSQQKFDLDLRDYPGLVGISIRNRNTGYRVEVSAFDSYDSDQKNGFIAANPISNADDAIIKYEGITIRRPTNDIDDVVPEITLHVHEKTEKTATLSVKPDTEAAKDALINFVGKYNQAVAELNILSQNKEEIVDELDYLSKDEKDSKKERLGMFLSDFSLTSIKSNMQNIIATSYNSSENAEIYLLSQIGIATNASGFSGSYSNSRLRGYLEIDEKKLDAALENHLDDIKQLFGYDSDGDLIVDSGIGFSLDKQIAAYTQTGGILAMKTSSLDSKIQTSERKISSLEAKLADTEADLRYKYGQMEGSLNSLEGQQTTISNFTKQQNNGR